MIRVQTHRVPTGTVAPVSQSPPTRKDRTLAPADSKRVHSRVKVKRRRRPWWKRPRVFVPVAAIGLLLALGALDAVYVAATAPRELRSARDHLQTGADALQAGNLDEARTQFTVARDAIARARGALGQPVVGLIGWLPRVGDNVDAVRSLADASGRPGRLRAGRALEPGGFALVSADTLQRVPGLQPGCLRVAAVPWPSLNNSDGREGYADRVLLRDPAGVVQDALSYSAGWGGGRGRSLERLRADPDVRGLAWAASKAPLGSTPGRPNSSTAPPTARLGLSLEPNPFSPDGDGRADALGVALDVPAGFEGFRASIFDLAGRRRRTLAGDRLGPGPRSFSWDGKDASGTTLPTGAYIFHLELYSNDGTPRVELRSIGLVR